MQTLLYSNNTPYELSVIMATYNEKQMFLHQCLSSIFQQTFQTSEIVIVVEPGEINIDYLEKIAIKYPNVNILKNKSKLGVSGSRNRGILESSGEYIAMVDGDDYCDVTRFEKQLLILKSNPEISIVGSNIYLIDCQSNIVGERYFPEVHKNIKRSFLVKQGIFNPTVMVRRKDLGEVGLFSENFTKAEDFELWLRFLAQRKRMYNLQEKLVYYRVKINSNENRGNLHFKNIYIARKRYSKIIWPHKQGFVGILAYFVLSKLPNSWLDVLLNLEVIKKIKNIRNS